MTGEFESCFDMDSRLIFFPIRHHSPACAWQLARVMEMYSPDCVLIEGPSDADRLIPYLADEGTVPPVCIYCSYDDRGGDVSEEKEKYRAYYPFLEYSPELAAIRLARERNIPAHFIDMPYGMQLVMFGVKRSAGNFGHDESAEYYRLTAEKSGCRCFSEFWERGFERKYSGNTAEFVKSVYMLGRYMRELSPSDERNDCRESYMREKIKEFSKQHCRILVVAGAYHIEGLANEGKKVRPAKYSKADSAQYLMPYTFAESDSRSGYGAGIPYPAYYSEIWKKLCGGVDKPYAMTAEELIVDTARYSRTKQPVSLPDETEALYMANSLAALRGADEPGAFELIDGVRSAFVKGDINTAAAFELDYLIRRMTGMGAGTVDLTDDGTGDIVPPCVTDFRVLCKKYRINIGTIARQSTVLEVVKKREHYEKSCFLRRLDYMGTGFCSCESGADHASGKDTSLIREKWSYRFSTAVEAKLIDLSVYGGSIDTICRSLLKKDFDKLQNAAQAGSFLLDLYSTGYSEQTSFLPELFDIIRNDTDFVSQCRFMAAVNKLMILQRHTLGETDRSICELLKISFETALCRIGEVCGVVGDACGEICGGLRLMYSLASEHSELLSRDALMKEIKAAAEDSGASPMIYGTCLALCSRARLMGTEEYGNTICVYMLSADGESSAEFLTGIISSGRDIIFTNSSVLESIDGAVRRMDNDKFREVLPLYRRAFTSFLPSETDRISRSIAEIYGMEKESLGGSNIFGAAEIAHASDIDRQIRDMMKKWGMS